MTTSTGGPISLGDFLASTTPAPFPCPHCGALARATISLPYDDGVQALFACGCGEVFSHMFPARS